MDLDALRQTLGNWSGQAESVAKNRSTTRFDRLNNQLILRMLDDHPDLSMPLVCVRSASSSRARKHASTYLVGRFDCPKPLCSGWSSGKVFTEIFVVNTGKEWKFDVVVWNQACRECRRNVSCTVDEATYLERVFSKLVLLLGLRDPIHLDKSDEKKTPPHDRDLCCACKVGKCQRA